MSNKAGNSICVLNNTLKPGGAEKNCVIICNELSGKGYNVELWVTRLEQTPLIDLLDKKIKLVSVPGKKVRNTFKHLKNLMLNSKSRTLLIFNIELLIPAFFINKIFRLNYKLVVRSISTLSLSYNHQGLIFRKVWLQLIKYTFQRVNKIIAQSSGMKEDLLINFRIPDRKIVVIPNPAFILSTETVTEKADTPHKNEILFIGRLTRAKGLFYLLDAFRIAKQSIPDLHLTMVGDGEMRRELEEKIKEMGLSGAITLEGYKTNLTSYYKRSHATVLTSVREGFPNVLVESILVGTPVISFDCPSGPADIIVPNVNGILVEYLNVPEFAGAIVDVVNGNVKFGKEAIIESSKRFGLDKIIGQYEGILFE